MAPTSLLAGIILILAEQWLKAVSSSIPQREISSHFVKILAAGAIRFGSFFLAWLLGTFALAAVATLVNELDTEHEPDTWIHDSYQLAREHLGRLTVIAVITFTAFLLGGFAFIFIDVAAFRVLSPSLLHYNYIFSLVSIVVIATIVSWLGAAIPLVLENTNVWVALKKSVELSNGYEGALFLLVVESVAGSFIVLHVVVHVLPLLLPPVLTYSSWYVWVLNLTGASASAAIESPLFIGFSLLADPERFVGPDVLT